MDNWIKSKWFVRIISLVFAVFLYTFVNVQINQTEQDSRYTGRSEQVQTLNDVPVSIRIDQDNYVVSGVPEVVRVTLEGAQGNIIPMLLQRNFEVYVDLHGLEEGDHTVELQHNVGNDVRAYIEPKTIDVTIEERATEEFTVLVDFINEGSMADGFEMTDYTVEPETITITSSRSVIDQVGIVKVYVDLANVDSNINRREVPVNVYDSQGNELSVRIEPESVAVSVDVDNPSKTVPVTVETTGELPEGYTLNGISANLEEVEIYARSSILSEIEEINTEEIDLSEITESGTMEVSLSLPEGVNVPDLETIDITIDIEQTRSYESIEIQAEGLGDGYTLEFAEPEGQEIEVTVSGDDAIIRELDQDDIRAIINLDALEPGEHDVPITIEIPGAEDLTITTEINDAKVEIIGPEEL